MTDNKQFVLFDCEYQCELMTGTMEEIDTDGGIFGGGNYNTYPFIEGYVITQVTPRPNHTITYTAKD